MSIMSARVTSSADITFHPCAPSILARRLRHAAKLLGTVELPSAQPRVVLLQTRGHLSGTMRQLERLLADVGCSVPGHVDDPLTEEHDASRIDPIP